MIRQNVIRPLRSVFLAAVVLLLASSTALAHCDGMDGPVVKAARRALETRDVNLVLIWVQQKDEAEISRAFEDTLAVRGLSPQAKELADRYFFETLVRLHRAGEGAPYTGLQPAGRDLGPAIPAADRALEEGSAEHLQPLLTEAMQKSLRKHFEKALARKKFRSDDLAAGREYVEAYVEFIHYVERIYEASTRVPHGHFHESEVSHEEPGGQSQSAASAAGRQR
jgi:uncharacterized protein DUF6448